MSKKLVKFGIVNHQVMTDPTLSLQAKALYSILSVYANKERKCFPSVFTLADIAGVSTRHIGRIIKELKDNKYITREGKHFKLV